MKIHFFAVLCAWLWTLTASNGRAANGPDDQWRSFAAREEIRPQFAELADGRLRIVADAREGLDGHWAQSFPVEGGKWYRFQAWRRTEGVPVPRRSVLARILLAQRERQCPSAAMRRVL